MPKTFRLPLLLATLALAALVAAGCGGTDVPSDSVAKVGDVKITKAQYQHWFNAAVKQQAQSTGQKPDQVVPPDPPNFTKCIAAKQKQPLPQGVPKPDAKALKAQCKQEYDGISQQTLQFLITSQWLTQEAAKRKISATDAEVRTTFNQQKKQSFPKEADYQKFLQTSGQTETDLLFRVKLSVLTNKIQQAVVKGKSTVSDAAVQDYYNKNKSRFAQPETRDLQVVLATKRPKALAALKAINSGTPWPKVAKQYSSDTASKAQGGRLPGVTKGQQEKTFDAAIFSAPKNKVVGPIKTQFGFYVFRVTKITPAKQQSLTQVKTTIKNLLQSQQQQKALNDFVKDWQKRSKDMTTCAKGYIVQQCKNSPKPKTNTAPVSGAPPGAGSGAPQTGSPQPVPVQPGGAGAPPGAGGGAGAAPPSGAPQPTPPSGP
jgi:foldase protein PrsA